MLTRRKEIAIAIIVLSSLVGTVFALSTLFTQNFPGVSAQAVLVANCGTAATKLTANYPQAPGPIPTGSSGTILFNCGTTAAALTAQAPGTVTPTGWTTPAGMTLALILNVPAATTCTAGTGTAITPSTAVVFGGSGLALGNYDYCLAFTSFPSAGVSAFSITWQQ